MNNCAAHTGSTSQLASGFMANEPCWWWMHHQHRLLANIFAKLYNWVRSHMFISLRAGVFRWKYKSMKV